MLRFKSAAWDGQTIPKDNLMFYYVAPNGFPTQYGSFEMYFDLLIKSTEGVEEITGMVPTMPERTDFHSVKYPAPFGFDNRPLRVWCRRGIFIGYEF